MRTDGSVAVLLDLEAHRADHENPHAVTAEQIGAEAAGSTAAAIAAHLAAGDPHPQYVTEEELESVAAGGLRASDGTAMPMGAVVEGSPLYTEGGEIRGAAAPPSNRTGYVWGWISATAQGWVPLVGGGSGVILAFGWYDLVAFGPNHYAGLTGSIA